MPSSITSSTPIEDNHDQIQQHQQNESIQLMSLQQQEHITHPSPDYIQRLAHDSHHQSQHFQNIQQQQQQDQQNYSNSKDSDMVYLSFSNNDTTASTAEPSALEPHVNSSHFNYSLSFDELPSNNGLEETVVDSSDSNGESFLVPSQLDTTSNWRAWIGLSSHRTDVTFEGVDKSTAISTIFRGESADFLESSNLSLNPTNIQFPLHTLNLLEHSEDEALLVDNIYINNETDVTHNDDNNSNTFAHTMTKIINNNNNNNNSHNNHHLYTSTTSSITTATTNNHYPGFNADHMTNSQKTKKRCNQFTFLMDDSPLSSSLNTESPNDDWFTSSDSSSGVSSAGELSPGPSPSPLGLTCADPSHVIALEAAFVPTYSQTGANAQSVVNPLLKDRKSSSSKGQRGGMQRRPKTTVAITSTTTTTTTVSTKTAHVMANTQAETSTTAKNMSRSQRKPRKRKDSALDDGCSQESSPVAHPHSDPCQTPPPDFTSAGGAVSIDVDVDALHLATPPPQKARRRRRPRTYPHGIRTTPRPSVRPKLYLQHMTVPALKVRGGPCPKALTAAEEEALINRAYEMYPELPSLSMDGRAPPMEKEEGRYIQQLFELLRTTRPEETVRIETILLAITRVRFCNTHDFPDIALLTVPFDGVLKHLAKTHSKEHKILRKKINRVRDRLRKLRLVYPLADAGALTNSYVGAELLLEHFQLAKGIVEQYFLAGNKDE